MKMSLYDWASERGYLVALAEPAVLDALRAEVERRRDAGELSQRLYEIRYVGAWRSLGDNPLPGAGTVIVLSVPRPAHKVTFRTDGAAFETIVAPTYAWYTEVNERIGNELRSAVLDPEHRLVPLRVPLKALAARIGLVTYGRHNITYAPGAGSYHQLAAFLTDADLGPACREGTNATRLSPECEDCQLCAVACPTGAIAQDRFLLHAERCLALFTEDDGPWPEFVPGSAHNCLFGCLECQRVCPQNEGRLVVEPMHPQFAPEETAQILSDDAGQEGPVWEGIKAKLKSLGLADSESVLGRNLKALMSKSSSLSSPPGSRSGRHL